MSNEWLGKDAEGVAERSMFAASRRGFLWDISVDIPSPGDAVLRRGVFGVVTLGVLSYIVSIVSLGMTLFFLMLTSATLFATLYVYSGVERRIFLHPRFLVAGLFGSLGLALTVLVATVKALLAG